MLFWKEQRSALLIKYMKINFLIIVLPVVISCAVYVVTIQNNYKENYLDILEHSVNEKNWNLDMRMQELVSTAHQMATDNQLTPYQLYSLEYSGYYAMKQLKSYTIKSSYFEDFVIHINDSDKLYTKEGVVDIDTFIQKRYRPQGDFSEKKLKEFLMSPNYWNHTLQNQCVVSNASIYNVMTYPLEKVAGKSYGTLIGFYENDWEELFQTQKGAEEQNIIMICTEDLQIIYSHIPKNVQGVEEEQELIECTGKLLMDWDKETQYYRLDFQGENYIGEIVYSDITGWYLMDMVKEKEISLELFMMQLPILIIFFAALLLLTVFLSMVLSMYSYAPIKHLYNLFGKKENELDDRKDELVFLDQYIKKMLEDQSLMEEELQNNIKISRMELVKKLLTGKLEADSPLVKEKMEKLGIRFEKKYMVAVLFKLKSSDRMEFIVRIKNQLECEMQTNFYLTDNVYKDYDAFLACVDDVAEVEGLIHWLIEQSNESDLQIGVGNLCSETKNLKYSLMEATIAVGYKKDKIVYFKDISTRNTTEFYSKPLESELKLKQLLVQGAAESLQYVMNELYNELLCLSKTESETVVSFITNRIWGEIFVDALTMNENAAEKYLCYVSLDEFMDKLNAFCLAELNAKIEYKENKEDKRIQKIIQYIDENYMKQEMSLSFVAQYFNMTDSYLSRLFKASVRKNFITYVTEKRLELAAKLLIDTDDPIGMIVEKVGYSDAASFSRKFTKYYLSSPGNYRKRGRKKDE